MSGERAARGRSSHTVRPRPEATEIGKVDASKPGVQMNFKDRLTERDEDSQKQKGWTTGQLRVAVKSLSLAVAVLFCLVLYLSVQTRSGSWIQASSSEILYADTTEHHEDRAKATHQSEWDSGSSAGEQQNQVEAVPPQGPGHNAPTVTSPTRQGNLRTQANMSRNGIVAHPSRPKERAESKSEISPVTTPKNVKTTDAVSSEPRQDSRVMFLPLEKRGKDGFRVIHIPKTAGELFTTFARQHVSPNEKREWDEDCLLGRTTRWTSYDPEVHFAASFFRSPREHVLSQYFQCLHGWGGMYEREIRQFPRSVAKNSLEMAEIRMTRGIYPSKTSARDNYDKLYKRAIEGIDKWLDFFLDGWYIEKGYFGCYHPLSMQVRAMTCYGPWDWMHGIFQEKYLTPDVPQAIANMRSLWFVGIKEKVHESLCIWEYQYSRKLPAYCDCKSGLKRPALESHVHGVPKHSLSDLSAAQLAKIDRLTEGDKELYAATVDEFMLRLREVEAKTGKQILCPK